MVLHKGGTQFSLNHGVVRDLANPNILMIAHKWYGTRPINSRASAGDRGYACPSMESIDMVQQSQEGIPDMPVPPPVTPSSAKDFVGDDDKD
ncbi:hypothetical protein L484_023652 [Morus notabilis]|uniref:Uncharacterized protein n=1 Tax=Morus notabilis TaxID=981085 RepID=W9RGJ9_9ROSA|nr:hypothetical protein L484_023652 [Morus notabilis]